MAKTTSSATVSSVIVEATSAKGAQDLANCLAGRYTVLLHGRSVTIEGVSALCMRDFLSTLADEIAASMPQAIGSDDWADDE